MNFPYPETDFESEQQRVIERSIATIQDYAIQAEHTQALSSPEHQITLKNPLCGDTIHLQFNLTPDKRILAISHQTEGCDLCKASAHLMCNAIPGTNLAQLREVRSTLQLLLSQNQLALWSSPEWQKLEAFTTVPSVGRHQYCVMLPFNALLGALQAIN